jgi:GWxTD domain-containing protein
MSRQWILAAAAGLLVVVVTIGGASAGLRAPLAGQGGFDFVGDMPVFAVGEDASRVDVAVRIDHHQLRFRSAYGNPFHAEIELHLKIAREGVVAVDTTQVYEFVVDTQEEATDPQRFQLIEMTLPLQPGNWAVTLELSDRQASKEGLRHSVESQASGVLFVPQPGAEVSMSDPEFRLRSNGRPGSLPNPERLYGVVQDTLTAYFELRGELAGVERSLRVEVIDPIYGAMDQQLLSFGGNGVVQARMYRLPLASFPEGNYVLRLIPMWLGEEQAREYEFTVVWKMGRFADRGGDRMTEAKLVLDADALERFVKLAPGAQGAVLDEFWQRHDPTPGTSRNETFDRFRKRVAYAWRFFGEALVPGPLTDRGRIYVRYGAPDGREIRVIPSNDDDLESAITKVHDSFGIEFEGVTAREEVNKTGQLGNRRAYERDLIAFRDRRRMTSRIGSEGSLELWEYDFEGESLFGEAPAWSENIGFRFLFVDRRGDGSYRLEFTNVATRG